MLFRGVRATLKNDPGKQRQAVEAEPAVSEFWLQAEQLAVPGPEMEPWGQGKQ
jgi:hypothetical protein